MRSCSRRIGALLTSLRRSTGQAAVALLLLVAACHGALTAEADNAALEQKVLSVVVPASLEKRKASRRHGDGMGLPLTFKEGRLPMRSCSRRIGALLTSLCRSTGQAALALLPLAAACHAALAARADDVAFEQKVLSVVPAVEDYIAANMKAFDVPGLAIGIVVGDKVVYAKGFGVRSKGGAPVDTHTVFQIGSATKTFLATTMAIAVDHGKLRWDDRVVDVDPDFQLKDPWVSQEFRVFDLLAQRSSLPPYANDTSSFSASTRTS